MRTEKLYLSDISEAADAIQRFLADTDYDRFMPNDLVRSAVLHKLTIIGEAAAHISKELRARYPDIPWSDIVGLRNIAVHAYFGVDWFTVWVTATNEVPILQQQIAEILRNEFPDAPTTP